MRVPAFLFQPTGLVVLLPTCFLGLYLLYRWLLPKPIPGIPYNESATRHLLGDIPEITKFIRKHGRMRPYWPTLIKEHGSPIVQLFMLPFSKPTVVVSDFREAQDILLRRTKEFDRGGLLIDIFRPLMPENQISMATSDPHFKRNRELVKDLMSPSFLNKVNAPEIYKKTLTLIEMWAMKAEAAQGRPFAVAQDLGDAALDIINSVAFGLDDSRCIVRQHIDFLEAEARQPPVANPDGSVTFRRPPPSSEWTALRRLGDHIGYLMKSPSPLLFHKLKYLTDPELRNAVATKDRFVRAEIDNAAARLRNDQTAFSAMDEILRREINAAAKEGRAPEFHSRRIHDELYGYINAGYDTTTASITWSVKLLADNQEVQQIVRSELHSTFHEAHEKGRLPIASEIAKAHIPYLEATMEEILRIQPPVGLIMRRSLVDTTILGRHIPKGVNVALLMTGPGYLTPAMPVPDELRSKTSLGKGADNTWNPDDVHLFKPERWLKTAPGTGKTEFDPQAGPLLTFGLGGRGCFGRRLAYLELRIVLVLLVWTFEFQKLNAELSSYDAKDAITTVPLQCFVGLKAVGRDR